jgi:hypothetical protein
MSSICYNAEEYTETPFSRFYFLKPFNPHRCYHCNNNVCNGCKMPIILGILKHSRQTGKKHLKQIEKFPLDIDINNILKMKNNYEVKRKKNKTFNSNKRFVLCLPYKYKPAVPFGYKHREFIKAISSNIDKNEIEIIETTKKQKNKNIKKLNDEDDKIIDYDSITEHENVMSFIASNEQDINNYDVEELDRFDGSIMEGEKHVEKLLQTIEKENKKKYTKQIFMEVIDISRFVCND